MPEHFHVKPSDVSERQVTVSGEEARHIATALRHKRGDRVVFVDGQGGEYECSLEAVSSFSVTARIINRSRKGREPIRQVTLAQAVPKGTRMDLVIEKGTELGVYGFIPLVSQNSVIRPEGGLPVPGEAGEGRQARGQRLAVAAMKQSLRSVLPKIHEPTELAKLWDQCDAYDLALMADESEKRLSVARAFSELPANKEVRRVLCIVGPEGGFSEEERQRAADKHVRLVTLGPRRLRAETAGLALAALALAQLGELG
jgi:16S rRNA (uracil1498-N3)-methyltransferase